MAGEYFYFNSCIFKIRYLNLLVFLQVSTLLISANSQSQVKFFNVINSNNRIQGLANKTMLRFAHISELLPMYL